MSEPLKISVENKQSAYKTLLPQLESLVAGEIDFIANLANICSAIQMIFNHLWVGFYILKGDQLVLGPFQGPIACTRINKGSGVCGLAWEKEETIIVDNVNSFEGHISCSSDSVSEIVVPIFNKESRLIAVLDIDSVFDSKFDETDQLSLEKAGKIITQIT